MSWQVGLYVAAVLIPLAAFAVEVLFIRQLKRLNAYLATGAIGLSFVLSLVGFVDYYFVEARGRLRRAPRRGRSAEPERGEPSTRRARGAATRSARTGPLVWKASFDWVSLGGATSGPRGRPARRQAALVPAGRLHRQPGRRSCS